MTHVLSPGARTLIQDTGRNGYEHLGVPTSGAADQTSLRTANRLAGNHDRAACLEIALHGPTLLFTEDTTVAYSGADTDITVDGHRVPTEHTLLVRAGSELTVGTLRTGLYGYLAFHGGITTPQVLGSRSSCTLSGLGNPALVAGDTIAHDTSSWFEPYATMPTEQDATATTVRYLPGPHSTLFSSEAISQFAHTKWAVSPNSSRVGVRLDGPTLTAPTDSLPSLGMVTGAIQVPPSGQPIVLGPDHGTTGGYPVIGVVVEADMDRLMQRPAGHPVNFCAVEADPGRPTSPSLVKLARVSG